MIDAAALTAPRRAPLLRVLIGPIRIAGSTVFRAGWGGGRVDLDRLRAVGVHGAGAGTVLQLRDASGGALLVPMGEAVRTPQVWAAIRRTLRLDRAATIDVDLPARELFGLAA